MMRHNEFLGTIEKAPLELDTIVARHRKDFTGDFFQHLHLLCESSYDDPKRRDGTYFKLLLLMHNALSY